MPGRSACCAIEGAGVTPLDRTVFGDLSFDKRPLRATDCIDRHQHVNTHYARYDQGVERSMTPPASPVRTPGRTEAIY
jgi:hypothetical protein